MSAAPEFLRGPDMNFVMPRSELFRERTLESEVKTETAVTTNRAE
jgi:hypothetical protein